MEEVGNIESPITESDVEALFLAILRRPVGNEQFKRDLVARRLTLHELVLQLRQCDELKLRMKVEVESQRRSDQIRDTESFRCPQGLAVNPLRVKRVLIVGSCLSEAWAATLSNMASPCESDIYLLGNALPESPKTSISGYDFQIVQLPLRSILPDASFAKLSQTDIAGHEDLFAHAVNGMRLWLATGMRWNRVHGILTFVFPFLVPQQNSVGRLMPRFDLRNPVYFVERLNEALAHAVEAEYSNAYFFDLNEVCATHGRRYIQEDMITSFNHGSFLGDFDFAHDGNRLEPVQRASDLYETRTKSIILAGWEELVSMYRTVKQIDAVKMVVVDLDDTLWRGVIADVGVDEMPTSEGWPKAFWEALAFLKRRGVLLAILSKNEEANVIDVWKSILGQHLKLEDFAIHRINWRPKAENMAEILDHVNLLPRNVVYIDDNPAQRSEIKSAFPDIRVLGGTPLTWRHILLWSAETQLPAITTESVARTEMVRAQVTREEQRHKMSLQEFLVSLHVRFNMFEVSDVSHARFPRILELINKTNQFNTTGRRWTQQECAAAIAVGTVFYAFEVADTFTEYGLVGVLVVDEVGIRQFVMSCRIMGLEAEVAAIAQIAEIFRVRGTETIFGEVVDTQRNLPCRDVYFRCGFEPTQGGWKRAASLPLYLPAHITLAEAVLESSGLQN